MASKRSSKRWSADATEKLRQRGRDEADRGRTLFGAPSCSSDAVPLYQLFHQSGIRVCAHFHDCVARKADQPAIVIVRFRTESRGAHIAQIKRLFFSPRTVRGGDRRNRAIAIPCLAYDAGFDSLHSRENREQHHWSCDYVRDCTLNPPARRSEGAADATCGRSPLASVRVEAIFRE